MSQSYWRALVALAALILMGVGSFTTYQLYDASQQRQSGYDYQPAAKPSAQAGHEGQLPPKGYQPNCRNPQGYPNADLCAQWAAVQQAAESNRMASLNLRFAIVSLWATVIGTILLLWTLLETRSTARRELRAYLFVNVSGVLVGTAKHNLGQVVSVAIVKNSGATPAHRVSHFSRVEIAPFADEGKMRAPDLLDPGNQNTVPPQGEITADRILEGKPTRAQIAAIRAGKSAVFVFGTIEYLDVFDRKHRTDYRLFYSGAWPPPPNPIMRFCTEGNTAT